MAKEIIQISPEALNVALQFTRVKKEEAVEIEDYATVQGWRYEESRLLGAIARGGAFNTKY